MGNLFDQFDAPSEASQPTLEPAPTPAAPPPNAPSRGPIADFASGLRAGINTLRTAGGEVADSARSFGNDAVNGVVDTARKVTKAVAEPNVFDQFHRPPSDFAGEMASGAKE